MDLGGRIEAVAGVILSESKRALPGACRLACSTPDRWSQLLNGELEHLERISRFGESRRAET